MVYGIEMNMPIDLVLVEVGRQRPVVYCPYEYMGWFHGSILDAHVMVPYVTHT